MKIFKNKNTLKRTNIDKKLCSFIPTMGGIHKGHVSLIKKAKRLKQKILVSIFVNPKQFNNAEDFKKYPRNLNKDIKLLKKLKVDYLYLPNFKDIYGFKPINKVFLHNFSKKLCGKYRKGHFQGVLNVVNRFLEITKPKYIFLGEKDFQQLQLIKLHILKKKIKTKIKLCKTIREDNGIPCSTRNKNLTKKEKNIASNIFRYLNLKKRLIKENLIKSKFDIIKKKLIILGVTKLDYLEIYNVKTLKKPSNIRENSRIFTAFYINKTRLIDNF